MSSPVVYTYQDVLSWLSEFLRSRATQGVRQEVLRGCCETALREIVSARDWNCMKRFWRVQLSGTQTTGMVTYSAAGGQYPYQVMLTGATWPDWIGDGELRIGLASVISDVDQVISPTVITLKPPRVPAEDVTTPTDYSVGRSWYPLPPEFAGAWAPAERNAWFIGVYTPFEEWYLLDKYLTMSSIVRRYTFGPAPNRLGTMAIYVYPWSANNEEYDILMKFRPRSLAVTGHDPWNSQGTVSVAAGSTTVTGSGSGFRALMQGSLIRFAADSTNPPTAASGSNPYVFQQSVAAVDPTGQTLTLGGPAPVSLAGVRYVVSDPIDIMAHMYDAFVRNCEKQLAHTAGMKDAPAVEQRYRLALQTAKMADSPVNQRTIAGENSGPFYRLWQTSGNRPWIGG